MGLALKIFLAMLTFANLASAETSANVDVKLSPAGSFKLTTKDVKGKATKQGNSVSAENIVVVLKNVNSGISLRDDHTKNKYLEVSKFPEATLISAKGENGKGTGVIKIKGIEKPISGTYAVKGNELAAQFDLKLSDFGIKGIKYMGVGVNDLVKVSVNVPLVQGVAQQGTIQQQQRTNASVDVKAKSFPGSGAQTQKRK